MARIHEEYIQKFLDRNVGKSFLGSELVSKLKQEFPELSDSNSKVALNRAQKNHLISSSNPLKFANNQYAYFSNKSEFGYSVLADSIRNHKKALHRALYALERNNGELTKSEVCKISGVTLGNKSKSITFDALVKDLKMLKIADIVNRDGTDYILLNKVSSRDMNTDSILEEKKRNNLVLYLALQKLVRSNIIDSKQLCFAGEANNYEGVIRNNELWDAFGFSSAVGIGSKTRDYQTLVLVDYLPGYCYEEYDFEGFKERVDRTVYSTKNEHRKVLPIIISLEASPRAYSLMKKNGYLFFDVSSLLGDKVFDVARRYLQNTTDIERKMKAKDSDICSEIIESLNEIRSSGNETNYSNLKGQLFEYLMYPVICEIYKGNHSCIIEHSYKGSVDGKKFECDYLVRKADENVIIELKGYRKDSVILLGEFDQETGKYPQNTVLWFLNQTFSLCSRLLGNSVKNKLCYITTADLEKAAKDQLVIRKKNKPNDLDIFYNHDSLLELLKKLGMKNEIHVIEQFYS